METYRVLVVDDTRNIHEDFRRILCPSPSSSQVETLAAALFDDPPPSDSFVADKEFEISSAFQGRDALELVQNSLRDGLPYALAFVDMRMPPGWDGLETIQAIWELEKELHVVICTAYSEHSWPDIVRQLGQNDRLLVMKKPFEAVEVIQCAHAMCEKWRLQRIVRDRMEDLEARVEESTRHLEEAKQQLEQEMFERRRIEVQLRHAQKLESLGQPALSVAHEINAPIQLVGNSVESLREGFLKLSAMTSYYRSLIKRWEAGTSYADVAAELGKREATADLNYFIEGSAEALERGPEGLARVGASEDREQVQRALST